MYMPIKPARPEQKAPTRNDRGQHGNGAVLTIEERHGALKNQAGHLLHRLGAAVLREHVASQPGGKEHRDDACQQDDRPELHENLSLLHSRRPTPQKHRLGAGQSVRDGRRRAERGSWGKTTHGDASHAATRV
jgi:hypothetical protein